MSAPAPSARRWWQIGFTTHANERLHRRLVATGMFGSVGAARSWALARVTEALDAGLVSHTAPAWIFGRNLEQARDVWVTTARGDTPVAILLRDANADRRRAALVTVIVHGVDGEGGI